MQGNIERADHVSIVGWVWDPSDSDAPVRLQIIIDDAVVEEILADQYREDLKNAGIGDGSHAFQWFFRRKLTGHETHTLRIITAVGGEEIPGSPIVLSAVIDAFLTAKRDLCDALSKMSEVSRSVLQIHEFRTILHGQINIIDDSLTVFNNDIDNEHSNRTILVIDGFIPRLNRDAGSMAVISHMQSFMRLGFRVVLFADHVDNSEAVYVNILEEFGIEISHLSNLGDELLRQQAFLRYVYIHRLPNMQKYHGIIRNFSGTLPIIYSVADLHFLRLEREIRLKESLTGRRIGDASGLRDAEIESIKSANLVITHSSFEKKVISLMCPDIDVLQIPWHVIVDYSHTPFGQKNGVAFIGSFGHKPNLDAAEYLISTVMPAVWRIAPSIKCILVGPGMPDRFLKNMPPQIQAMGYVPDLRDVWRHARLSVAPLRFGAGLKGKVLTSFAAGIPCLCYPVAAEGFDWPSDLNACITSDVVAMSREIVRLHESEFENRRLGEIGREWINNEMSATKIDKQLEVALQISSTNS
jgi:glycosyltransferase involved in cell wall biosynthesis